MEEKLTMRLKSLIDGEIEFKFNNVRNCKGILNSAYKHKLLSEKSKEKDKFKGSRTLVKAL